MSSWTILGLSWAHLQKGILKSLLFWGPHGKLLEGFQASSSFITNPTPILWMLKMMSRMNSLCFVVFPFLKYQTLLVLITPFKHPLNPSAHLIFPQSLVAWLLPSPCAQNSACANKKQTLKCSVCNITKCSLSLSDECYSILHFSW